MYQNSTLKTNFLVEEKDPSQRSNTTLVYEEALNYYLKTKEAYNQDRYFSNLRKRDMWFSENMKIMLDIIYHAGNAEKALHLVQPTDLFNVNSSDFVKERSVDWHIEALSQNGDDVFSLDESVQESPYSLPAYSVERQGRIFTPDFLRKLAVALRIKRYLNFTARKLKVIEVGSGCGALARTLQLVIRDVSHVFIDLPETLFFAFCFIRINFPEKKCLYVQDSAHLPADANEKYDFIFVPTAFLNAVVNLNYDIFVNTDSFGEMPPQTVAYYFDLIQNKLKVDHIFSLNRFLGTVEKYRYGADPHCYYHNVCSWLFDKRWDILSWMVEPYYSRCPYVTTRIARCVEIIGKRVQQADEQECRKKSEMLVSELREQDWTHGRLIGFAESYGDNILCVDVSQSGVLFKLWESIRLNHTAENIYLALRYLGTLVRGTRTFKETFYLEDWLRKIDAARYVQWKKEKLSFHFREYLKAVLWHLRLLSFAQTIRKRYRSYFTKGLSKA